MDLLEVWRVARLLKPARNSHITDEAESATPTQSICFTYDRRSRRRIHVQQQGSTTKMSKGWRLKNALIIRNIVNDIIDKWRRSRSACRKLGHPHKSLGAQQESYEYIKILEQILHPDAGRCQREAASMCARHAHTSPWHIDLLIFFLKPILVGPVCCVRRRLTAWAAPFVVYVEGKQWKVTDKGTFVQRDRWSRTDWQTKRAYKWLRRDGLWRMLRAEGDQGGDTVAAAATLALSSLRPFLSLNCCRQTDRSPRVCVAWKGERGKNDEWVLNPSDFILNFKTHQSPAFV